MDFFIHSHFDYGMLNEKEGVFSWEKMKNVH